MQANTTSFLFFSTAVEHRTFRKTVRMLQRAGASVRFTGFTRHNYPHAQDGLEASVLGRIGQGNYLRRFLEIARHIPLLRREAREYDILYCFSLDALVIGCIASIRVGISLVYQVQDIRPVLSGTRLKNRAARFIERIALSHTAHVVISSQAYYERHFKVHYGLPESRTTLVENKLEFDPSSSTPSINHITPWSISNTPLRVGYFGMLRCSRSWSILTAAVEQAQGSIELFLRGKPVGIPSFDEDVAESRQIYYGGPYRDPDELYDLYAPVHMVWAAYPYGYDRTGNWQWARTVRFYEAGAFFRPMIVQAGTQDAKVLAKYDIGLIVDMSEPAQVVQQLLSIRSEDLERWSRNLKTAPRSLFVHANEYQSLKEQLEKLVGK